MNDDIQVSALYVLYEIDGRKSRKIIEVLDWYRENDAGDLEGNELNELVENMTALNPLEEKGENRWNSCEIENSDSRNPKIVTDEESRRTA